MQYLQPHRKRRSSLILLALGLLCICPSVRVVLAQEDPTSSRRGEAVPVAEEVLVEARVPEIPDPADRSGSVTVLELDEHLPAGSDVAEVLGRAAGVATQRLGGLGDWSGVSIRGSSLRQVQVYLDGVPLNPDGSSAVNLAELPLTAFQYLEVYRSNPPLRFTGAPMGGVLNLVTGIGGDSRTDLGILSGSFGAFRANLFHTRPISREGSNADVLLVAEGLATRGDFTYFDDSGTVYNLLDDHKRQRSNNDKAQINVHGRWRKRVEKSTITVLDAFLAREEGLPGHINNRADDARLQTTRNLTAVQLDREGTLGVTGRIWSQVRDERLDDPAGEIGVGGAQRERNRFGTLGVMTHLRRTFGARTLVEGVVETRREVLNRRDLLEDLQAPTRVRYGGLVGLGGTHWLKGPRLSVNGLLQSQWLDNRALGDSLASRGPAGGDRATILAFTPRAGLLFRPGSRGVFKANVGRSFRPPDLTELFGDRGTTLGNADLRPERGWQADVGGMLGFPTGREGRTNLELATFWNQTRDLIVFVQNAQQILIPINLGTTQVKGLEAAVSGQWHPLRGQASLTRNLSTNLSSDPAYSGKQIPLLPNWLGHVLLVVAPRENVELGYTFDYADGNFWDATNWYRSAPRAIHGLFARAGTGEEGLSIELRILNLTDHIVEVTPRDPLNPTAGRRVQALTDFNGYPLPGRTAMLSLSWRG